MSGVYVLGGYQTDFAEPWSRRGLGLFEMLDVGVMSALEAARVTPAEIDSIHIGNFVRSESRRLVTRPRARRGASPC